MTFEDPADIFVLIMVVAFISFVIYVIIQGSAEEKRKKDKQEDKK